MTAKEAKKHFNNIGKKFIDNIASDFVNGPKETVFWEVVSEHSLHKFLSDYMRLGFIMHEPLKQKVKERFILNAVKLCVSSSLSGLPKLPFSSKEDIMLLRSLSEHLGFNVTDPDLQCGHLLSEEYCSFSDWLEIYLRYKNNDILTDLAYLSLKRLTLQLIKAEDDASIVSAINKILMLVHPSFDLSLLFVEGGRKTLTKISHEKTKILI